MKLLKKTLTITLAAALCLGLSLPFASAADPGQNGSGSASLPKLSKQEIVDLLNSAPLTMPDDPFVTVPSCAAPYAAGEVKSEVLDAAAARLSALRRIAGLPAVTADPELCGQAQYGAVLLAASEFSHYPKQPSDMDNDFYSKGKSATSSSNIFAGLKLTYTPDGFMDDSDGGNIDRLGHRRWQLNPQLGKVGFGYATVNKGYRNYTAEKVFDRSGNTSDYSFVAWPASGNFPSDLSAFGKNTAWSVSLNPSLYQTPSASSVSVTLTRASDGKAWSFSGRNTYRAAASGLYFNVETGGYGINNCIIFRPDGIDKYEGVYTVTVNGLRAKSGGDASLSYQVDFFSTKDYEEPAPTTPATPTNPTTPTAPSKYVSAMPTNDGLICDGKAQSPTVFKINGSNYFKIRDLAAILNGTEKQFSVGYDSAAKSVAATSGEGYAGQGGELAGAAAAGETAMVSNDTIYVNGKKLETEVYKIGGGNYFKLRDLGRALDFYVGYDGATKTVSIDTGRSYSE